MTMLRKLTKSEGIKPIPSDIYPANVTAIRTETGTYGDYLKIDFTVSEGVYKGEQRTIIASDKFMRTVKGPTKLVEIIEAVKGQKIDLDQEIDLDALVGMKCRILLGEAKDKDGVLIQNVQKVLSSKE